MISLNGYECERCGEEFVLLNVYAKHCVKCGYKTLKKVGSNYNTYSLYNHKTGFIEDE